MKRIISILLVWIMLIACFGVVSAEETISFENGVRIKTNEYTKTNASPAKKNGGTAISVGIWISFDLTAPENGVYLLELQHKTASNWNVCLDVLVDEEAVARKKLLVTTANSSNSTDDWDTEAGEDYWEELCYVDFSSSSRKTVKLSNVNTGGSSGPWSGAIRLTKVEPVEFLNAYVGGEAIDGEVSPGTDAVTFKYADKLSEDTLESAKAVLTDEAGIEYKAYVDSLNDNKDELCIAFCEALKKKTSYTLSVSGIYDMYGYSLENTVEFATSDETDGEKTSKLSVEPFSAQGREFLIKGKLIGSLGQAIGGREIMANVTSTMEGAEAVPLDVVITDEKGEFVLKYTVTDSEKEFGGNYKFEISSAFAQKIECQGLYVSEQMINDIFAVLEEKTTALEVEEFLSGEKGTQIGFAASDITTLLGEGNTANFYQRLADATYKNDEGNYDINVFEAVCYESKVLEDILINGASSVEKYFENSEFCEKIGLESSKYLLLTEEGARPDFFNRIDEITELETLKKLGELCNSFLDEYVLSEFGKPDTLSLDLKNVSTLKNKAVDITLKLSSEITTSIGYTLNVKCPDKKSAEKIELGNLKTGSVTKSVSQNTAIFEVMQISNDTILKDLGTLCFSYSETGDAILNISGTVTYSFDEVEIEDEISSSEVTVSVTKNTSEGSYTPSSRPSSSGKVNSVSQTTKTESTEEVSTVVGRLPAEVEFNDLESVSWAKESIYALCRRGIISRADDGKFRPNDYVTRAEFVKMLCITLDLRNTGNDPVFPDVDREAWYYINMKAAYINHIITGDENGNLSPDDYITRQDMCVILGRAMDNLKMTYSKDDTELFADDEDISAYAKDAVYRMRKHNIVGGVGNGEFKPKANATRAETAKVIYELTKVIGKDK